jgi:methyltransferase FkbM-like protein
VSEVYAVRLDSVFARDHIDILKIDVEEFEEEVLKGTSELLGDPDQYLLSSSILDNGCGKGAMLAERRKIGSSWESVESDSICTHWNGFARRSDTARGLGMRSGYGTS